ncbi:MAG: hypothetical protein NT166_27120 [Candidatus Aminicenantes bacterium]|nr:hypothetical protein [Candidatus Aminicenantes bacterium]
MKTNFNVFCLLIVGVLLFTGSTVLFGQIDNLTNMSAEWIRLSNRNAALDAVDIVVYNPAGLIKLADGFHFNISNQTLIRKPEHGFDLGMGKETYSQDGIDPFIPNFYAAYKKDRWALFGGIYLPAGGAVVDYPHGSINTKLLGYSVIPQFGGLYDHFKNDFLKATSLYLTFTAGGAYAISDFISIAGGLRYIDVKNTTKLGLTAADSSGVIPGAALDLNAKMTGSGIGGIIGVDIFPLKGLNIGIRYETKVKLELTADIITDSFEGMLISQGDKSRRDLPAMLGVGVSYDITDNLRAEADFNYFFQKQADWGTLITPLGELEYAKMAGDCYSMGACLAYRVNPKFQVSTGFLYTVFDFRDMAGYFTTVGAFEVLYSDNCNLGAGFSYALTDKVKLNVGMSTTIWKDETIKALAAYPLDLDVKTTNKTFAFAIGADISL